MMIGFWCCPGIGARQGHRLEAIVDDTGEEIFWQSYSVYAIGLLMFTGGSGKRRFHLQ
jgi:hypothetical protein